MPVPMKRRICVGTSGWGYADWRGKFYPSNLPKANWFRHYSTVFDAVELNSTFYGTPKSAVFQAWACAAPDQFVYALKADRDLTHRVGKDRNLVLKALCDGARALGVHRGPILYQFPPWLERDLDHLDSFLGALPRDFDHVIEFRHSSWYRADVQQMLMAAGIGFCIHDMYAGASPAWMTTAIAYMRLHGPTRAKYTGLYGGDRLREISQRFLPMARQAREAYIFFNNTAAGAAAQDAIVMRSLLAHENAALQA